MSGLWEGGGQGKVLFTGWSFRFSGWKSSGDLLYNMRMYVMLLNRSSEMVRMVNFVSHVFYHSNKNNNWGSVC